MKQLVTSVTLLFCALAFFAALSNPSPVDAFTKNTFFGGKINKVVYCTCVYYPGTVVFVDDLASNKTVKVLYSTWTSKLWPNYNIWESGPEVIGGFYQGGECLNQKAYYCTQNEDAKDIDGTIDWMRGIGSSASGGSSFGGFGF